MLAFSYLIDDDLVEKVEQVRKYLPVNVKKLAEILGLKVQEVDDIEHDGYIEYKDDGFTIYVNKTHSENRRRFTIAHEIAHFLLHLDVLKKEKSLDSRMSPLSNYTDRKEAEANSLAADILMPIDEIDNLVNLFNIQTAEELAKKLIVSELALKIKLGIPGI